MFRNCDIAGCENQTGDMGTPPNRASIMHTGNGRYLHRTTLAPTAYQTRKYNHTLRISARPPIARSQQIIFDISEVKTFRELQKSRSIRHEAARCFALKRTAHKRKIQHPVTFVFPVIGKT